MKRFLEQLFLHHHDKHFMRLNSPLPPSYYNNREELDWINALLLGNSFYQGEIAPSNYQQWKREFKQHVTTAEGVGTTLLTALGLQATTRALFYPLSIFSSHLRLKTGPAFIFSSLVLAGITSGLGEGSWKTGLLYSLPSFLLSSVMMIGPVAYMNPLLLGLFFSVANAGITLGTQYLAEEMEWLPQSNMTLNQRLKRQMAENIFYVLPGFGLGKLGHLACKNLRSLRGTPVSVNHLIKLDGLKNRYFVIRHGESQTKGIIITHPNHAIPHYGLTKEGRKQIERETTKKMEDLKKDGDPVVISSDFRRARESAEVSCDILGIPRDQIQFAPPLRERHFGFLEGRNHHETEKVWALDDHDFWHTMGRVESGASVVSRTTRLIVDLEKRYSGKTFLLVTHGETSSFLNSAFRRQKRFSPDPSFYLENGEIHELNLRRY